MPLIMTRRIGESLVIDGACSIRILESTQSRVSVEITAADSVNITRGELIGKLPWAGAGKAPVKHTCQKWRYRRKRT